MGDYQSIGSLYVVDPAFANKDKVPIFALDALSGKYKSK